MPIEDGVLIERILLPPHPGGRWLASIVADLLQGRFDYVYMGLTYFVAEGALPMLIVDDELYRSGPPPERDPPRVLLSGHSRDERHGLADGYGAVAHARWFHQKVDLIRVSPWAPSREEPLDSVQEFHVALTTAEMTRLVHSCDVLVGPSLREEPFGLAAAEPWRAEKVGERLESWLAAGGREGGRG